MMRVFEQERVSLTVLRLHMRKQSTTNISTTKYLWTASFQILFLHYFCFCSILIT